MIYYEKSLNKEKILLNYLFASQVEKYEPQENFSWKLSDEAP